MSRPPKKPASEPTAAGSTDLAPRLPLLVRLPDEPSARSCGLAQREPAWILDLPSRRRSPEAFRRAFANNYFYSSYRAACCRVAFWRLHNDVASHYLGAWLRPAASSRPASRPRCQASEWPKVSAFRGQSRAWIWPRLHAGPCSARSKARSSPAVDDPSLPQLRR
jgi:hypothetical protein